MNAARVSGSLRSGIVPVMKGLVKMAEKEYSSDISIDMDKEFLYTKYPYLRKENSPDGVSDSSEILFHTMDFDELCYLLEAPGTHLVMFGGVWSEATQSIIDHVNACAAKHNVPMIHLYDFSSDGTEEASIKRDLTEQETYDGPGKRPANGFAIYNYLYGELVCRNMTNLDDWVPEDRKAGHRDDITFLNNQQDAVSVANLKEPFLFLFNKDNTVDNSGCGHSGSPCPIMWAAEFSAYRDAADGQLYSDPDRHDETTLIEDFDAELEEKIFCHVDETEVVSYTASDYIRSAFGMNKRGHSYKTQPAFEPDRQINIQKINFQELYWLINQKGSFMIHIAGPWCAYSQGSSATVNDYAVANGLRVYMSDIRLDSKHAIDFWGYGRQNEITISCPPMRKYYADLWENYFAEPYVDPEDYDHDAPWTKPKTVDYVDENGVTHSHYGHGVPYLQSYNKDMPDENGKGTLEYQHGAYELINTSEQYIYYEPNYKDYKAQAARVFKAYTDSVGKPFVEITIDRTAPIAEGKPVHHPENPKVVKEHNWYVERADRAN